jgi:hypothetical protein
VGELTAGCDTVVGDGGAVGASVGIEVVGADRPWPLEHAANADAAMAGVSTPSMTERHKL